MEAQHRYIQLADESSPMSILATAKTATATIELDALDVTVESPELSAGANVLGSTVGLGAPTVLALTHSSDLPVSWDIDWGDGGSHGTVSNAPQAGAASHTYAAMGIYTVTATASAGNLDPVVAELAAQVGVVADASEDVNGANAAFNQAGTAVVANWNYAWPQEALADGRSFTVSVAWTDNGSPHGYSQAVDADDRSADFDPNTLGSPPPNTVFQVHVEARMQTYQSAAIPAAIDATALAIDADTAEVVWSESRPDLVPTVTVQQSVSEDGGLTWSDYEDLDTVNAGTLTYTVNDLEAGKQYRFKVVEIPTDEEQTPLESETAPMMTAVELTLGEMEDQDITMSWDSDGDGVPDYMDGLNGDDSIGFNPDDTSDISNSVPITIHLLGGNTNFPAATHAALLNARLSFSYEANDPSLIPGEYDPEYTPTGKLRLWKSNSASHGLADFIAPDTDYSIYDLCGDVTANAITIYVQYLTYDAWGSTAGVDIHLTSNEYMQAGQNVVCARGANQSEAVDLEKHFAFVPTAYTASMLDFWLTKDTAYGPKVRFLLSQMHQNGKEFKVEYLVGRDFDGTADGAYVDSTATSLAEAKSWALDALREFAGCGTVWPNRFFFHMAFEYAKPRGTTEAERNDVTRSIGDTLDWLYFFSKAGSSNPNWQMYSFSSFASDESQTNELGPIADLLNIFCYAYTGVDRAAQYALVGLPVIGKQLMFSNHTTGGLHDKYCDFDAGKNNEKKEQADHFAAYFELGAHFGNNVKALRRALEKTGDYSGDTKTILNVGDFNLGVMAADWGKYYKEHPDYWGASITDDLRTGTSLSAARIDEVKG